MSEVATGLAGAAGSVIDDAAATLEAYAHQETDGLWLEYLTVEVATHIREWNVDACWRWDDWMAGPGFEVLPDAPPTDVGIDLVARRRDDGEWIAIQAKSRKLDEHGEGRPIPARELDTFLVAASDRDVWAERWVTVNGSVRLSGHSPGKVAMSGAPVKMVNVAAAVEGQRIADAGTDTEGCPHCEPGRVVSGEHPVQTRSCMQREAVKATVSRLRAHEQVDEENIPRGEARGRIILPCGTGKTRIALRITEQLTYHGELSVVLCPSIALVAQIRREFLQHTNVPMRMLAVCSDKGVAANDEKVRTAKTTRSTGVWRPPKTSRAVRSPPTPNR